jgi:hypothetical protein
VLARAGLTVLVAPDGDVLGAVVLGKRSPAERGDGRPEREQRREGLLGERGEARAPDGLDRDHAPRHRTEDAWPLERQLGLRQAAAHLGEERKDLRNPGRAARETVPDVGGPHRLGPRGDFELAGVRAHGARPVARPVHEHAVRKRHAAQADRWFPAHAPRVAATWRRKRTPSSRSATSIRSSAEWIRRAASSASMVRMGKKP